MQWVHDNAAQLGADSSRVMIFGESAGAGSVSDHLVNLRSRGLFSRAAMESGPLADWTSASLAANEKKFSAIASALKCPVDGNVSACLRARSAEDVEQASRHVHAVTLTDW